MCVLHPVAWGNTNIILHTHACDIHLNSSKYSSIVCWNKWTHTMWSAMLSGDETPFLNHPVRFVACTTNKNWWAPTSSWRIYCSRSWVFQCALISLPSYVILEWECAVHAAVFVDIFLYTANPEYIWFFLPLCPNNQTQPVIRNVYLKNAFIWLCGISRDAMIFARSYCICVTIWRPASLNHAYAFIGRISFPVYDLCVLAFGVPGRVATCTIQQFVLPTPLSAISRVSYVYELYTHYRTIIPS